MANLTPPLSDMRTFNILNLGAGVQSSVLLLMSCMGILPKVDAAIFADTQWEPPAVYKHLEWLKEQAAKAGIPLHVVTKGDIREDTLEFRQNRASKDGKRKRYASIPFFIKNPDGSQGLLRRQCTHEYKILPIERFIRREIVGLAPRKWMPKNVMVRQWFGITSDEMQRMRISKEGWRMNEYPFIGDPEPMLDRRWNREDCHEWFNEHFPNRHLPRSACVGCPFHNNAEWRHIKKDPELWADACDFDDEIRKTAPSEQTGRHKLVGTPYVHRSMIPLRDVDLTPKDGTGSQDFGFVNECEGMCGV